MGDRGLSPLLFMEEGNKQTEKGGAAERVQPGFGLVPSLSLSLVWLLWGLGSLGVCVPWC